MPPHLKLPEKTVSLAHLLSGEEALAKVNSISLLVINLQYLTACKSNVSLYAFKYFQDLLMPGPGPWVARVLATPLLPNKFLVATLR